MKTKFKDQNLFNKILIVAFWLLVAVFAFWPAVIILAIVLGIIISLLAILFCIGLALLPVAACWWLLTRNERSC